MTTVVNITRQTVLTAQRDFKSDDFVSGTPKALVYTKPGTRILRGFVDITSAFQGTSTITLSIGDTSTATPDVDRWKTAFDIKSTGLTAITAPQTNSILDAAEAITATVTAGGTLTAGAGRLVLEFIEENRATEFHPYRG